MKKSKKPIIIFILIILCAAAVTAGIIWGSKEDEKHQAFYEGFTKYAYKDDDSHYLYFDKDGIRSDGKYRYEFVVETDHSMKRYYSKTKFDSDGSAIVTISADSKGRDKLYSFAVSEENGEYFVHDLTVKNEDTDEYIPKLSKNYEMSKETMKAEMQAVIDEKNREYEEEKREKEKELAAWRKRMGITDSSDDSSEWNGTSTAGGNSSSNSKESSRSYSSSHRNSMSNSAGDNDYYEVHSYDDADSFAEDHYEDFMEDEDFDDEEEAYDEAADYWDANN